MSLRIYARISGILLLATNLACISSDGDAAFADAILEKISVSYGHFDIDKGSSSNPHGKYMFRRAIGRDGFTEITIYGVNELNEIAKLESIASNALKECKGKELTLYFYEKRVEIQTGPNSFSRADKLIRKSTIKVPSA